MAKNRVRKVGHTSRGDREQCIGQIQARAGTAQNRTVGEAMVEINGYRAPAWCWGL